MWNDDEQNNGDEACGKRKSEMVPGTENSGCPGSRSRYHICPESLVILVSVVRALLSRYLAKVDFPAPLPPVSVTQVISVSCRGATCEAINFVQELGI